jgi:hypothetical protein
MAQPVSQPAVYANGLKPQPLKFFLWTSLPTFSQIELKGCKMVAKFRIIPQLKFGFLCNDFRETYSSWLTLRGDPP